MIPDIETAEGLATWIASLPARMVRDIACGGPQISPAWTRQARIEISTRKGLTDVSR